MLILMLALYFVFQQQKLPLGERRASFPASMETNRDHVRHGETSASQRALKSTFANAPATVRCLTLQFRGQKLEVTGGESVAGAVRMPRMKGPQAGLYHRVVDETGGILFENVVPDPRVMHYDFTDDGRRLSGGVAVQADTPLNLRLPGDLRGKLQIYLARSSQQAPASQANKDTLLAQVDLP